LPLALYKGGGGDGGQWPKWYPWARETLQIACYVTFARGECVM